jgi:hypothetical protein
MIWSAADDGAQTVGDDEAGAPFHQRVQRSLDDLLGGGVHAARRLVQDQDARVGQQGAGEGEICRWPTLRLPPFSPTSRHSLLAAADEVVGAHGAGRRDHSSSVASSRP